MPPNVIAARNRREAARQLRLREAWKRAESLSGEAKEWSQLAISSDEEHRRLVLEVDDLTKKLARKEATIWGLEQALAGMRASGYSVQHTSAARPIILRQAPGSVREAVEVAMELFDSLQFLPAATDAADNSTFMRTLDVLDALQSLAEVAVRLHTGKIATTLADAFAELGQDYAADISEGTPKRIRMKYQFKYHGRMFSCYQHLRLGVSRDPTHCLRIYFCTSPTYHGKVVVGHVGRHLPSGSD